MAAMIIKLCFVSMMMMVGATADSTSPRSIPAERSETAQRLLQPGASRHLATTTSPSVSSSPSESSAEPSTSPSPSLVPTTHSPSLRPSDVPSSNPSQWPTVAPSTIPSSHPSSQPSNSPTDDPTLSLQPSASPSNHPTWQPSQVPSVAPSQAPTWQPSSGPSMSPTITLRVLKQSSVSIVLTGMEQDLLPSQIQGWERIMNNHVFDYWNTELWRSPVQVNTVVTQFVSQRRLDNTEGRLLGQRNLNGSPLVLPLQIFYSQTISYGVLNDDNQNNGGGGIGGEGSSIEEQLITLPFETSSADYAQDVGKLTSNPQIILVDSVTASSAPPSSSPSQAPTPKPTEAPTAAPTTLEPTQKPTEQVTQAETTFGGNDADGDSDKTVIIVSVILSFLLVVATCYICYLVRSIKKPSSDAMIIGDMISGHAAGETSARRQQPHVEGAQRTPGVTFDVFADPAPRATATAVTTHNDQGATSVFNSQLPPPTSSNRRSLIVPKLMLRRNRSEPPYQQQQSRHQQQQQQQQQQAQQSQRFSAPNSRDLQHHARNPPPSRASDAARMAVVSASFESPVYEPLPPPGPGVFHEPQRERINSDFSARQRTSTQDSSYVGDAAYNIFDTSGFEMQVQELED